MEELFLEYDTGYVSIPWAWTKGVVEARNPPEKLDVGMLNQLITRTKMIEMVPSKELDTVTNSLLEEPQQLDTNSTSEAGAAFGGKVAGGYSAHFHQTWEMPIPSVWRIFSGDACYITVDVVVDFTASSFKPDERQTDQWVWTIDTADVLSGALPVYTNFRYIEAGMYRCIMKAVGRLVGGASKLRFGFNFKTIWTTGSQTTTWHATTQLASNVLTTALWGYPREIEEFSEDQVPKNSDLDLSVDSDLGLNLLFYDTADEVSHAPTE